MAWISDLFNNSKEKGDFFEAEAEKYLIEAGLTPVARNFHSRYGEIDLIMKEQNTYVFVEVKYRKSQHYGGAQYALSFTKKQRLKRTLAVYIQQHGLHNSPLRIDFVAINGQNPFHITWYKNVL